MALGNLEVGILQLFEMIASPSGIVTGNLFYKNLLLLRQLLEELVILMDSLSVWHSAGPEAAWFSQVQVQLLLGFIAQDNLQVCCKFQYILRAYLVQLF